MFIKGNDIIWYKHAIQSIKKKYDVKLQPVFEAFTNSLEACSINSDVESQIIIRLFHSETLIEDNFDFVRIEIEDNGIGFNEINFTRFKMWGDDRKSPKSRGAGRVQLLHYFTTSKYISIFKDDKGEYKERQFILSKSDKFLKENAIIQDFCIKESNETEHKTILTLKTLLNDKDQKFYNNITAIELKKALIAHYLPYFCAKRNKFPTVKIEQYYSNQIKDEETLYIKPEDIPECDKNDNIVVYYSKISNDGKSVVKSNKSENLALKAFKISAEKLDKNAINLTVKNEIVENKNVTLEHLSAKDQINGKRYLFLLSGEYIDNIDGNTRGEFIIPTAEEFKKKHSDQTSCFENEEILIDDIEDKTNSAIIRMYKEIKDKNEEKNRNIEELQKMFLLNPETISSLKNKINIEDSDGVILQKVYEADVKIIAKKDAEIRKQIKELDELDTTKDDYQEKLTKQVDEFVKIIPLQNKVALTQYIARRKLVLELFDKILENEINKLKNGGRIDEDLLHNLIFQQSSNKSEFSDLWLIEEDFIYFKGFSEHQLKKIKINGKPIFNNEFTVEEQKYLNSLGEKRLSKRPDVLLFPDEGKCLLIEFKAPDRNASEYLSQIDFYANLIRNYTVENIQITAFYGYLIGESIEDRDVRGHVSSFEHSYHLDYWFRPSQKVTGFNNRPDGSIYMEVLKFTALLKRAQQRNKIFIEKLEQTNEK